MLSDHSGASSVLLLGRTRKVREWQFLFKNNFEYKVHSVVKDDEGRYILIDIEMLNKRMTIANTYAPSSGDHPDFFLESYKRSCTIG